MKAQKWHLPDHPSEQIKDISGTLLSLVGLFKGSHNVSKSFSENLSKPKRYATYETVKGPHMQMVSSLLSTNIRQKLGSTNPSESSTTLGDCAVLVRSEAEQVSLYLRHHCLVFRQKDPNMFYLAAPMIFLVSRSTGCKTVGYAHCAFF